MILRMHGYCKSAYYFGINEMFCTLNWVQLMIINDVGAVTRSLQLPMRAVLVLWLPWFLAMTYKLLAIATFIYLCQNHETVKARGNNQEPLNIPRDLWYHVSSRDWASDSKEWHRRPPTICCWSLGATKSFVYERQLCSDPIAIC
jgi:hypothetical protein